VAIFPSAIRRSRGLFPPAQQGLRRVFHLGLLLGDQLFELGDPPVADGQLPCYRRFFV